MALSKDDVKNLYPIPVYNYKVEINGEIIGFSEVSGLNITVETSTYKESKTSEPGPGPNVFHMPAQGSAVNVTLKKGLVKGKSMVMFYEWINSVRINQVEKKDITVRLGDEEGNAVFSWKLIDAFPTKLDAPSFDSNSNDVAIESLEVMASALFMEEN